MNTMPKTIFLLPRTAYAALKPKASPLAISRNISRSSPPRAAATPNPKKDQDGSTSSQGSTPPKPPSVENVLANTNPQDNPLIAPVHIPEDANAILTSDHPAADILTQSGIVVQRQIEMMNIFLGFEQANRYVILDPQGNHIGYMTEHNGGLGHSMKRQFFTTHRAFTTHIFDRSSREVLRFHRPFSWINTRIKVYDPWDTSSKLERSSSSAVAQGSSDPVPQQQISPLPLEAMRVIGETHSRWAPLRRKYDLFLSHNLSLNESAPGEMSRRKAEDLSDTQQEQIVRNNNSGSKTDFAQFAKVDEPFLSWDFSLLDEGLRKIGGVNREFRGFGREIFTDTGSYVLRMDAAEQEDTPSSQSGENGKAYTEPLGGRQGQLGMTLDQRAVMLATAVTIDFDYFSRHSGGHGFMPLWFFAGGGEAGAAAGAGAAGAGVGASEAGTMVGGAGRAVGSAGVGEGAIAGAGTMAGYEAMQRGTGRSQSAADDASPQQQLPEQPSGQPYDPQSPQNGLGEQNKGEDVWGSASSDPWEEGASSGGETGGGEGGGWLSSLWDSFWDN